MALLPAEIEKQLHEDLSVRAAVELMPAGSLPRSQMNARFIRRLYEE